VLHEKKTKNLELLLKILTEIMTRAPRVALKRWTGDYDGNTEMFNVVSMQRNQQTTELWNLTGTHIHLPGSIGSTSYAQGSLIPGSNYSAQDDHAGVQVAGL